MIFIWFSYKSQRRLITRHDMKMRARVHWLSIGRGGWRGCAWRYGIQPCRAIHLPSNDQRQIGWDTPGLTRSWVGAPGTMLTSHRRSGWTFPM